MSSVQKCLNLRVETLKVSWVEVGKVMSSILLGRVARLQLGVKPDDNLAP